jgi:hypothetical protein
VRKRGRGEEEGERVRKRGRGKEGRREEGGEGEALEKERVQEGHHFLKYPSTNFFFLNRNSVCLLDRHKREAIRIRRYQREREISKVPRRLPPPDLE